MERISDGIIKHKLITAITFLSLAVISVFLFLGVTINYSLVDYLPQDSQSTKALTTYEKEFKAPIPNGSVVINNVSVTEALEYKQRISAVKGVSNMMWLDDVVDVKQPTAMIDKNLLKTYYRDGSALFSFNIDENLDKEAIDEIYKIIGNDNQLTGDGVSNSMVKDMTSNETSKVMIFIIPIIILILLLSTSSWLEPILFIATIGVAVVINVGTNVFFGEISFVTATVGPILQLAVSLDYAIFLMHSFNKYRHENHTPERAMKLAMKSSFHSISASAATTLFGFAALGFMNFGLGSDLGINLAKGIVISFLSVILFFPVLTLFMHKAIDKTMHRTIRPNFKKFSNFVVRMKIPALIIMVLIIVPSFLGQHSNDFLYGSDSLAVGNRLSQDVKKTNDKFGRNTPIVILLPKGQPAKEVTLIDEIKRHNSEVSSIVSYASTVDPYIPPNYLGDSITKNFYSKGYSRVIVNGDTPKEGDKAFNLVKQVQYSTEKYYGKSAKILGESVSLYDMKNSIRSDTLKINFIAIIAIALIILISFRSLTLPLLLILSIEAAIWLNLALPYFMGSSLNYVGFLIMSSVQLGATIDYAIFLTEKHMQNRRTMELLPAMKKTLRKSPSSIFVSSSIMAAAGFCLMVISKNPLLSELGLLLCRGTIMSVCSVLLILPALLMLFDKAIGKTTLNSKFIFGGDK